jgi:methyl coenzyme M reductase subunit C
MDIVLLKKISQLTDRVNELDPLPNFGEHIEHNYGNTENSVCEGDDPRLSNNRDPNSHTHNIADLPSNLVTNSIQVIAGDGLTGGGTLASNVTVSHANTSDQVSILLTNPSAFINGVQLDTYGHIVTMTSGIVPTPPNNYLTEVTGSGNEGLAFARQGLSPLTVSLAHTHSWANITNTPITIAGYNLSGDAYTKTEINNLLLELPTGIRILEPVKAATTANITLSGTQTIDTVSLSALDRVLVKNQTNSVQNGVYVVSAGAWARAGDLNESSELEHGVFYFVQQGDINGASGWMLDLYGITNPIINSTAVIFKQFFASSVYTPGTGLLEVGNQFSVDFNAVAANVHTHAMDDVVSGILPVGKGGTGTTTHTSGNVLIGNGTAQVTTLSRNGIDTRTVFPHDPGHVHDAGAINTGTLPVTRGGTGRNSLDTNKVVVGNGTNAASLVSREGIDTRSVFPADPNHNHNATQINAGTLDEARLPLSSNRLRRIFVSANNPTGGADGDIWFKVY